MAIEKFISHHQGLAFTNRMRQEEMLDKSIRDFAARASSSNSPHDAEGSESELVLCPSELKELDNMLSRYRELSLQVIRQQHLTGSVESESRKAAQNVKMDIEKYIGMHKKQARCTRDASISAGPVHGGKRGAPRLMTESSSS